MVDAPISSKYAAEFMARTKYARERAALTQEAIATVLGINQGTYKQYETRTPLPHRFVPVFCLATHIDANWLFTGRSRLRTAAAAE